MEEKERKREEEKVLQQKKVEEEEEGFLFERRTGGGGGGGEIFGAKSIHKSFDGKRKERLKNRKREEGERKRVGELKGKVQIYVLFYTVHRPP